MRSKANNFIGALHNSAAIPGVIVFPLRLSCRDESLMHSCLGIMDGTGQLLPNSAAGAECRGHINGGEGGVDGGHMECGQGTNKVADESTRGTILRLAFNISQLFSAF